MFSYGQENSVGINTTTPNENAVLELVSPGQNQGFLVPRLSTLRRQQLEFTNAENGMMVYDINEGLFFFWKDGGWVSGLGVLSDADAKGDLTGTYPAPLIRAQAVTNLKLANLAVSTSKIQDNSITTDKINDNSITTE